MASSLPGAQTPTRGRWSVNRGTESAEAVFANYVRPTRRVLAQSSKRRLGHWQGLRKVVSAVHAGLPSATDGDKQIRVSRALAPLPAGLRDGRRGLTCNRERDAGHQCIAAASGLSQLVRSASRARSGEAGKIESSLLILTGVGGLVCGHGWSGGYSRSLGEVVDQRPGRCWRLCARVLGRVR